MRSFSSTLLTPRRRRCSHTLLETMFKACGFVLVGENNHVVTLAIFTTFDVTPRSSSQARADVQRIGCIG